MGFIRKLLDEITAHILITLGLGLVAAAGTSIWAHFSELGPWSAVIGLATLALLISTANGVQAFFERRPRRLTSKELASQLTEWLETHGYDVTRKSATDTETDFELQAVFRPGGAVPEDPQKVVIQRFSDPKEPLLLSAATCFGTTMRGRWAVLPAVRRADCIAEAQIEMMHFGLSFTGMGDSLEVYTIFKRLPTQIYYGNRVVSEKSFIEEVQLVRRASKVIELLVRKALVT